MKTLVLGIGNPILRDDGVGLRVAQRVRAKVKGIDAIIEETSAAGADLLDLLLGYEKVIIIDAIQTGNGKPGEIYRFTPDDLSFFPGVTCSHTMGLPLLLRAGRRLGLAVPSQVTIIAIEAADVTSFGEECSPEVEQAIPRAVDLVLGELGGSLGSGEG